MNIQKSLKIIKTHYHWLKLKEVLAGQIAQILLCGVSVTETVGIKFYITILTFKTLNVVGIEELCILKVIKN